MPLYTPSIERLQKKLDKEPNSLIFLQLAEEYRKEGYYEDALKTCQDGLKRHPNYWSARVAMGRIYYEMADYDQARDELEKVIKAVPDNLLANKLLGDIYLHTDRSEEALKRYQIVQMLTPNDQDVVNNIRKLEATLSQKTGGVPLQSRPAREPETELNVSKTEPDRVSTVEIPGFADISKEELQLPDQNFSASSMSSGDDSYQDQTDPLEKTAPVIFFDPARGLEPGAEQQATDAVFPASTAFAASEMITEINESEEVAKTEDQTQPMDEKEEDVAEHQADELTTQTLAELYVKQGLTDKAIKVYQKLLLKDPGNQQIINRLKELNPADSLLGTGFEEKVAGSSKMREVEETAEIYASSSKDDQLLEERRKKISTLENWLTSIRRERP